jgi:hypothetical protein
MHAIDLLANGLPESRRGKPVAALLQGKRSTSRELVFLDFERMVTEWPTIVSGAEKLVAFLAEESVIDGARLPSEVVLAPLTVLWANAG